MAERSTQSSFAEPGGVDADALLGAVVDGDEDGGVALGVTHPGRRQQPGLAHSRSTRALLVRMPASCSRAQTLRCPSPSQGEVRIASRMCSVSSTSLQAVSGPRFRGGEGQITLTE